MLIDEKVTRRVDSCGRISLPKHLRVKFDIDIGEEVEFYIYRRKEDGQAYICLKKREVEDEDENSD